MKVDIVVLWVDGADPEWRKTKSQYTGVPYEESASQYRDWETFHYWFRGVEQYASWVDRVFLVTCGQVPKWLNTEHPKLKLVFHKDFMPEEYLPTFNSRAIELNLHRIPELSDHFVYFNDDTFLNAPTKIEDFFCDGLPRLSAIQSIFIPAGIGDTFQHALCNDVAFINDHFNMRESIKKNRKKWFSPVYGKSILKNVYFSLGNYGLSVLQNFHMPAPMLKSTYEKVWELDQKLLHNTSLHKLRSEKDVNQYIMNYYDIATGKFVPRSPKDGKFYTIGKSNNAMYQDILNGTHKLICINDTKNLDFEKEKEGLISAFDKKFPEKCIFEK